MANFLYHTSCNSCSSSDAKAIYDDGSTYCFSCSTSSKGNSATKKEGKKEFIPYFSSKLPQDNIEWLRGFGLNDKEIGLFSYSPYFNRHVYQVKEDGKLVFWEGRAIKGITKDKPKTLSFGPKPYHVLGSGTEIVICEDIVSGLRISRYKPCFPLFGSYLSTQHLNRLAVPFKASITIWLDEDKYPKALEIERQAKMLFDTTRVIFEKRDPKNIPDKELKEILNGY